MTTPVTKKCIKCKQDKSLDNFYIVDKNTLRNTCNSCAQAQGRNV